MASQQRQREALLHNWKLWLTRMHPQATSLVSNLCEEKPLRLAIALAGGMEGLWFSIRGALHGPARSPTKRRSLDNAEEAAQGIGASRKRAVLNGMRGMVMMMGEATVATARRKEESFEVVVEVMEVCVDDAQLQVHGQACVRGDVLD